MEEDTVDEILHLNFNSDYSQFTCTTQKSIKLYTTTPFLEYYTQPLNGGIKYMEKLGNTNTLVMLGGGDNPKYQGHKLMIWDDYKQRSVRELAFKTDIIGIKVTPSRLIAVFDSQIKIYDFKSLKLVQIIQTYYNPQGLISLNRIQSKEEENFLKFAILHENKGYVQIYTPYQQKSQLIKAHSQEIQALQLNSTGNKIATASLKGTIIKIFDTDNGQLIQELRRGSDSAIINCLNFDQAGKFLVTSSSNGTIHVFNVRLTEQEREKLDDYEEEEEQYFKKNKKSALGFLKKGELSIAQFKIEEKNSIVAFSPEGYTFIVLTYSGKFYRASFDPYEGGECFREEEEYILPPLQLEYLDDYL